MKCEDAIRSLATKGDNILTESYKPRNLALSHFTFPGVWYNSAFLVFVGLGNSIPFGNQDQAVWKYWIL